MTVINTHAISQYYEMIAELYTKLHNYVKVKLYLDLIVLVCAVLVIYFI